MDLRRRAFLAVAGSTAIGGCLGGTDGEPDGGEPSGGWGGEADPGLPPPVAGDTDSDVTVVAFADFACPHCARFDSKVRPRIESEYVDPGRIRYEHRDFPIPVDEEWSWAVADAARSVQDAAGDGTFFEYAAACFSNQGSYSYDVLGRLADDVHVEGERVVSDAREGAFRPVIEADRELGVDMGVEGTPEVYVNGGRLEGSDYETLSSAIEAEL